MDVDSETMTNISSFDRCRAFRRSNIRLINLLGNHFNIRIIKLDSNKGQFQALNLELNQFFN